MLRAFRCTWLSIVAFALASSAGIDGFPSVKAQEAQPKPAATAPNEPTEISGADFAVQADAVQERLEQIRSQISAIDVVEAVKAELDEISTEATALTDELKGLGTHRVMSSELNSLRFRLEALDARCRSQITKLTAYGDGLEKLTTQNDADIEAWSQALQQAERPSMPKAARDQTASILQGLHEGRKELQQKLAEVLVLQSQALSVRDVIRIAEQNVDLAQQRQVRSVYERQYPPLWEPNAELEQGAKPTGYDVGFSWAGIKQYVRAERDVLFLQLVLVVALGWLFLRMRALVTARIAKRKQTAGATWEDRAFESLRHPWSAALLLGLASVRISEPEHGTEMFMLAWAAGLPLWFVVYREMVPVRLRKALIGLGLLGGLHIGLMLVSNDPRVERILLLVELSLTFAGSIWLIRLLRAVRLSGQLPDGFWLSLTVLWARFVALISLLGLGATMWGYAYLALEAGAAATLGTIAATAWMALARIIEAVVSTSVYEGRLDALRMIRINKDITTKRLRHVIRLAAAALFVWALADMTSAWRPVGAALGRALSADVGLGLAETTLTFGDLLAFFVILWVSWITSRLMSFVLRQEIFPRLHMKEGVPYALTTFARYAIIAIGFIAAIAALGVPLDKVTIILSALGVGIGFGLQKFVSNVVSGFILLTERPFRLRDKIQIDDLIGSVTRIGIRASSIRTFDGAEVIIPNDDLISGRLINWTLSDTQQRETISVGVAYGTDPNEVLRILRRLASEHEKVHKSPAPVAVFRGFGDSSLNFELRVFMDAIDVFEVPSDLAVAIDKAFAEAGITIPFPQRDVHLHGVPDGPHTANEATQLRGDEAPKSGGTDTEG